MTTPKRNRFAEALLLLVAVPVLGVLMGGVYSLPAMKLTRERDPGLTLLLSVGLGITVFGFGGVCTTPFAYLLGVYAFTLGLLVLARRAYGSLGHSLERFGVVHAAALVATALVSAVAHRRVR